MTPVTAGSSELGFASAMDDARRRYSRTDSPDRRCETIAARQHGVVSRPQALDAGLSSRSIDRRIETGAWIRRLPRVYVLAGSPAGIKQDLWAASHWAGDDSIFSHRGAAHLLGFEGFEEGAVELSMPRKTRTPAGWVIVHTIRTRSPGTPDGATGSGSQVPLGPCSTWARLFLTRLWSLHSKAPSAGTKSRSNACSFCSNDCRAGRCPASACSSAWSMSEAPATCPPAAS